MFERRRYAPTVLLIYATAVLFLGWWPWNVVLILLGVACYPRLQPRRNVHSESLPQRANEVGSCGQTAHRRGLAGTRDRALSLLELIGDKGHLASDLPRIANFAHRVGKPTARRSAADLREKARAWEYAMYGMTECAGADARMDRVLRRNGGDLVPPHAAG
jgi:hypothetical protein